MSLAGAIRWGLLAAAILVLEALCRMGIVAPATLPAPSALVASLAGLLWGGGFWRDIWLSLGEIAAAAAISVALGFAAGLALHRLAWLRAAAEPVLGSFYAVPSFMLYPVFILLLGVGPGAIVAIAVLLAMVAMVSATLTALDRVPPVLRRSARLFGMGPAATAWRVLLPAAAPHLFTGLKLVVAYAFVGVIASEFILSGAGLGYAIAYAYNNFQTRTMYALMLLVVIAAAASNAALEAVDRRLHARWGR